MKKFLLFTIVLIFVSSLSFADAFAPSVLKIVAEDEILYEFGGADLEINFTLEQKPANMYFVVYEGPADVGIYNLISAANLNPSATGEGWYSSGPISVPMTAGMYYLIETQWDVPANYFNNQNITPFPIPASFGELVGCSGWNWVTTYAVPPATTQNVATTAIGQPVAYYQTIVTGAGVDWLTADTTNGIIQPGGSMDVTFTFDPFGLLGGDYYANVNI